ncbi:hypothetical protein JL721_9683 [Aureococcus anophagefferens]|nr:hypothetical protein JL721_9683 [Aureococcus anophagefferens]
MRRSVGLLAVAASVAAAPRPSPNSSGPYFVRRWTWPAAQRGRGAFLSASDFVVNGTVDGCDATSVVCAATPKNAPARLSGTHWQHAQQVLLPCWSLFSWHPKKARYVLLTGGVGLTASHPWTAFVLDAMGATVVADRSGVAGDCPLEGRLRRKTGTGDAGSEILWLADPAHAAALQAAAGLSPPPPGAGLRVGVLNRRSHRRWDADGAFLNRTRAAFPDATVADEAYFEALAPAAQAAWVHAADVVLFPATCMPGFYLAPRPGRRRTFAGYATDDPEGDRPGNRNQKGRYWFNRKFKYRKTDANPAVVADALPALADARRACLADLDGG